MRWGQPGGSLPSPDLSSLFCWGEQPLHPPEGVLVPQPGPRRVWWSSLEAVCQEAAAGQGLGTTPSGLQVALSPRVAPLVPRAPRAAWPLRGALHMHQAPRIPALPALRCRQLVPCCSPV